MAILNRNGYVHGTAPKMHPAIGDKTSTILGPPVCKECMTSHTRTRHGWKCAVCGNWFDNLQREWFYHMFTPAEKEIIDANDKFYNFMGKHKE